MPPLWKYLWIVILAVCPGGALAQTGYQSPASDAARETRPVAMAGQGLASSPSNSAENAVGQSSSGSVTSSRRESPSPSRDAPILLNHSASHSGRGLSVKTVSGLPSLATTAGSLAVVLGLFFALVWMMRRASPKGSVLLPGEVVEVLGRAPLAGRQQMHLLRCGNKLLLVSVTPAGAETLTEVTDPLEVDRLAGLCRQAHPQSATAAFRQVFQQFAPKSESRNA
jgi:flagellar biogenesis protein FliO